MVDLTAIGNDQKNLETNKTSSGISQLYGFALINKHCCNYI